MAITYTAENTAQFISFYRDQAALHSERAARYKNPKRAQAEREMAEACATDLAKMEIILAMIQERAAADQPAEVHSHELGRR